MLASLVLVFLVVVGTWLMIGKNGKVVEPRMGLQEGVVDLGGRIDPNFPEFPRYPGIQVLKSYRKTLGNNEGFTVIWEATDAVDEVTRWYVKELVGQGWEVEGPDAPGSEDEQVLAIRKSGQVFNFIIKNDGERDMTLIFVESILGQVYE